MYFSMCLSVREYCDHELEKENNTITFKTVGKYLRSYILSIFYDISNLVDNFVEICKIIWGMEIDPKKIREELDKM